MIVDMRLIVALLAFLAFSGCLDSEPETNDTTDMSAETVEHNHEPLTFYASEMILAGTQGADSCGLVGSPLDTVDFTWEVPENGTYRDFTIDLTWDATGLDLDLFVSGPSGPLSSTAFNPLDGDGETVTFAGLTQPGTYQVSVVGCTAVATTFEVSGHADPVDNHE